LTPSRSNIQTGFGAHPFSYSKGTWDSFTVGKWQEVEVDHSPPSNVEVKNAWSYNTTLSTPLTCFHIMYREKIYLSLKACCMPTNSLLPVSNVCILSIHI